MGSIYMLENSMEMKTSCILLTYQHKDMNQVAFIRSLEETTLDK